MFYMFYDPTYFLILIGMVLSLAAQAKVKGTFTKYSQVTSFSGYTGAEIARKILDNAGLFDVRIEHIRGNLSDHYDPRNKVLRLSDSVYASRSVAAIGVAAHEVGHAIQHQKNYAFLTIRNAILPAANLGSKLAFPIILLGLLFAGPLVQIGVILFGAVLLFQVVTLPVEFNASSRALQILSSHNYLSQDETEQAKKVLSAAAMTYVAAAVATFLSFIRLIILFGNRD
ncbi:zinc metallopeptidase [Vallitalea okinawensis]|uniref:zinc metallopeptidase n=1 Tax=Vallitalea okinawensis TaxID=2078660 RepID=UPI0038CD9238